MAIDRRPNACKISPARATISRDRSSRGARIRTHLGFTLSFAIGLVSLWLFAAHAFAQSSHDPWTLAQTVQPGDLLKEMSDPKAASRPTVVCVGFRPLYEGAHVPGAALHGAASSPKGMDDLKSWAQGIPRSANLVIYCGCCPLVHCPNVRPAFEALRTMGFRRIRVLLLPNDFATDWAAKGYPVEKGN